MRKSNLLSLAAALLFILGVIMIILGVRGNIIPPTVTGVGFVIIAVVFWKLKGG